MKILFGVQGTGNGHISRANALSSVFATMPDVEVTWLLSGRPGNRLLQVEGAQMFRRGLTFATHHGGISLYQTLKGNNPFTLIKDIYQLDLHPFDLLVTDYEPNLSWAAKLRGRQTIGVGHQYAFKYKMPLLGNNFANMSLLKHFAPADIGLGLHWHHFNSPILPPICDLPDTRHHHKIDHKIVVYLPFEHQPDVIAQLKLLTDYEFFIYSPDLSAADDGHIHTRPLSVDGFKHDLVTANGVIANTGFELISECLCLGTRVLTKPLSGQVEQRSNGAALAELDYAEVVNKIDTATVKRWLIRAEPVRVSYPKVHDAIAHWLVSKERITLEDLSHSLWRSVQVERGLTQVPTKLALVK